MKTPLFQSAGLECGRCHYPGLTLTAGGLAGWRTTDHAASVALFDLIMGLCPPPPGAAVWFGHDLARLTSEETLGLLRRLAPLTSGGGLIGNLNIGDNIMLPLADRNPPAVERAVAELEEILDRDPWRHWLPGETLARLPFQVTHLERCLAGVLRAYLLKPEVIVSCHFFHLLEAEARQTANSAVVWLREARLDAAWLVLTAESQLPEAWTGNILKPKR